MAKNKPTNNKKMSGPRLAALIVTIAILLGLVLSLLAGSGFFVRIRKGASSENFKVNGSMMAYYANSYYQNWYQQYYIYIAYGLISFNPNAPLSEQLTMDGKTNYYDYFTTGTADMVTTYLKYCEAAKADPDYDFAKLEADAEAYAKTTVASMKTAAKASGINLKGYIRQYIGENINVRDLKKALKIEYMASTYYQEVYDEKLEAIDKAREDKYFQDHLDEFISAEYIVYTVASIAAETIDEKKYPLGKEDPEYKKAVAEAEEKAKKANELSKVQHQEDLNKLAEAAKKGLDEYKKVFLELKYESVFTSTYDTTVKNWASTDKPTAEALAAYKAELKDKVIDAAVKGLDNLPTEEAAPASEETTGEGEGEGTTTTPTKTKWETAQETFPKTLITALKKAITDSTKTINYTLDSDLGKYFFAGVKAQFGIEEAKDENKNAPLYDIYVDETEFTADADKAIAKYSISQYFVTKTAYRDDDKVRNVGHILFKVDTNAATNATVSYKTSAEAKAAAEKLLAELQALADAGTLTKEIFEEKAAVTHDSNVFYENVTKGQMVEAFETWLFDATTVGQLGLVETTYGWHIMYFNGEGEDEVWRPAAEEGAAAEDMDTWFKALPYSVTVNTSIFEKIFNK